MPVLSENKEEGNMGTLEWNWHTNDGLKIYSKAWEPDGPPKAVVCLVHGVGEHIGRYEADGLALNEAGYVMAGFDQRGFGRSQGQRGHTPSLEAYFDDIQAFLGEVASRYPGLPQFLYGHSMGAVLVVGFTSVRQPAVRGVIATALHLKTALTEQKFKVFLSNLLGSLVPTLTIESGVDGHQITRDPQAALDGATDPLCHPKITTSWGKSMLKGVALVGAGAPTFPLPLLLMHGTQDEIAYPISSRIFAEAAPAGRVTLKMWEGFRHELHTDPDKAEVFKTMIDWLDCH